MCLEKIEQLLKIMHIEYSHTENLRKHTTIHIGGIADYLVYPQCAQEAIDIFTALHNRNIPCFILGGGSNLLVADKGIRGVVISTKNLNTYSFTSELLTVEPGALISYISALSAEHALGGIESFYSMPGTIGGAVWMNARCYGTEIADLLKSVQYCDTSGTIHEYSINPKDFAYKDSPFQSKDVLILSCKFRLHYQETASLWKKMYALRIDRIEKGHFAEPSLGSIFKNNRKFKQPTGKILDKLHVRGMRRGDAQISRFHANILVNTGEALADDARSIVELLQQHAFDTFQIVLEPELLYVGEWDPRQ